MSMLSVRRAALPIERIDMNTDDDGRLTEGDDRLAGDTPAATAYASTPYPSASDEYGSTPGANLAGNELAALSSDIKTWVGANPAAAIAMAFGAGWLACRISR
jgi:hypothetical protein